MRAVGHCFVLVVTASWVIASCTDLGGLSGSAGANDAGAAADGAATDAGTASDGGGGDGGGARSCPADAFFCEDFEGTLAAWSANGQSGATCNVNTTRAHGGSKSMRAFAPYADAGGGSENQCTFEHSLPLPKSGTLGLRAYVYVVGPAPTSGATDLAWFRGTPAGCPGADMLLGTDRASWTVAFYQQSSNSAVGPSIDAVPTDRWFCVELVAALAPQGHVSVFVDGTAVIDTDAVTVAGGFCGFGTVEIGLPGHSTNRDAEIYWDDVVVAPHRVGCQ